MTPAHRKESAITTEPRKPHLTEEDLSGLIDRTHPEPIRHELLEHLRSCPICSDAFQESALYRELLEADPSAFAASRETVALGKEAGPAARSSGKALRKALRPRVFLRLAPATLAVAVALALVLWLSPRGKVDGIDPAVLAPIRGAVETASAWGPIVLPGGEGGLGREVAAYRSGGVPLSDELESALSHLYDEFIGGDSAEDVGYWLAAGYFATGRNELARNVTTLAQRQYPRDYRIATLAGLVFYEADDFDAALANLREAVRLAPGDPMPRLDLAIVLANIGRFDDARPLLEGLVADEPGSAVADRAAQLLDRQGAMPDPRR